MNIAQFRIDYPEFADPAKYPAQPIELWSSVGAELVSADRWGNLYERGVELFTAHNLVIATQNKQASTAGGTPGQAAGLIQSKAVGSVNVSYDTTNIMEPNAGHWNQTSYGRQYIQLARLLGGGCVQL